MNTKVLVIMFLFFGGGVIAWLWLSTAIRSHVLLTTFKAEMPQRAFEIVPELFSAGRNPKKVLFFLTEEAAVVLSNNPRLLEMRNQFVRMVRASILLPFLFVGGIALVIFFTKP